MLVHALCLAVDRHPAVELVPQHRAENFLRPQAPRPGCGYPVGRQDAHDALVAVALGRQLEHPRDHRGLGGVDLPLRVLPLADEPVPVGPRPGRVAASGFPVQRLPRLQLDLVPVLLGAEPVHAEHELLHGRVE